MRMYGQDLAPWSFPGFSRRGLASTLSSTTNGAGCSTSKGQTKSDGRSSQCWAVVPSSVGSCKTGNTCLPKKAQKLFDGHFSLRSAEKCEDWWKSWGLTLTTATCYTRRSDQARCGSAFLRHLGSHVTLQVMSPRFELMASNPGLAVFWRHRRKFLDLECMLRPCVSQNTNTLPPYHSLPARFMCFHDGSLNVLPGFSPGRIACASQRPEGHQVQTRASFRGVVDWYWEPGTLGRSWDFRMKILKIIGILACLWLKILRWFKASNPSCFDAFCIGRLTGRAPVHLLHELKIKDLKLDTFRKPSDQQDSLSPPFCIPSVGNKRKTTSHLKPLK